MNIIATEKAPGAIGPYSQAYEVNGVIYTSGQIPVDPATGNIAEGIAAQAEQSCKNVGAILEAAGSGYDKVVKTTCFLAEIADFAAFNEVYAKYFTSKPARSCVAVKDLPKGVLCEVEAIGVKLYEDSICYWIFIFCGNHSDSRKMWNPENRFRCGHRDSYGRGAFIFLADGAEYRNHMGNREY